MFSLWLYVNQIHLHFITANFYYNFSRLDVNMNIYMNMAIVNYLGFKDLSK